MLECLRKGQHREQILVVVWERARLSPGPFSFPPNKRTHPNYSRSRNILLSYNVPIDMILNSFSTSVEDCIMNLIVTKYFAILYSSSLSHILSASIPDGSPKLSHCTHLCSTVSLMGKLKNGLPPNIVFNESPKSSSRIGATCEEYVRHIPPQFETSAGTDFPVESFARLKPTATYGSSVIVP